MQIRYKYLKIALKYSTWVDVFTVDKCMVAEDGALGVPYEKGRLKT